jgi:hypothetical protein
MVSITFSELITIIFVLVDDWYQMNRDRLLKGKAGRKPIFSDSEVMTLMMAHDFLPFPSETQNNEYIRANYIDMFPNLLSQSQMNRRSRSLHPLVEEVRRSRLAQKGILDQSCFLLDTKPVPVVGYKRSKKGSNFIGNANYGHCASRNMKYFGYKLVLMSTLSGVPVAYDLVPANTDERLAAEAIIDHFSCCDIFADKGFIGIEGQSQIIDQTNNRFWTPKRKNEEHQNDKSFDRLLSSVRERIEGVFHELQNTGRNLERLLSKTIVGLCARVTAKIASHFLRHILLVDFGVNVQKFCFSGC